MKFLGRFAVLLAALVAGSAASEARVDYSPVNRIVALLSSLKSKVEVDGKVEQREYDKFACWTEETLNRVAADMDEQRKLLKDLEATILELSAAIATHGSEVKTIKKDIEENKAAQKDATELRDKEHADYMEEKIESEQCAGALEAAIKVLSGAGLGSGKFLQKVQEAQLLSVVAGVRDVLRQKPTADLATPMDLDVVKHFVEQPEEFVGGASQGLSAAQTGQNPYGDYAPQSTQIQGILKELYDGFTSDLEKGNADEAEKQKAYEQLMQTKKQELLTLQKSLAKHQLDKGEKTADLAESKALRKDTEEALASNKAFFEETKTAGRKLSMDWSGRVHLRTQELVGMNEAIEILSGGDADRIFRAAHTTLLQLKSISRHMGGEERSEDRGNAYKRLRALATRYQSMGMASIAMAVKSGGHFDKIIAMIDSMVDLLRREEKDDIEHRDRCQNSEDRNTNAIEDLDHDIDRANSSLDNMNLKRKELEDNIETLDGEINSTQDAMTELQTLRNAERENFLQALKDDTDAVGLLSEALDALQRFYQHNRIPLSLAAQAPAGNYSQDPHRAPEVSWSGSTYGGAKTESRGVIAILELIKEDLEKEMVTGRENDAVAQQAYEKQRAALQEELDAKTGVKVTTEKELAKLIEKIVLTEQHKSGKQGDLETEEDIKKSLYSDCSWVADHFETRRTKRNDEIQGLVEAKNYLAGVDAGAVELPP